MAIPIGTTSRQLEALARWLLVAMMALGMLTWWWPGYRGWGALSAGMLIVLAFWLLWRTVSADRTLPGHPIHAAFLVPAAVLVLHVVRAAPRLGGADGWTSAGALNVSMIFHFALLALGVMLSQSLLPKAARHVAVLAVCGAAMMLGPAAAMAWGRTEPVRTPLALLGFTGVGVWLSTLWGIVPPGDAQADGLLRCHRRLRIGCGIVAACACVGLTLMAPLQALLMAGIVAGTLLVAGVVFRRRRLVFLLTGGALAIAVLVVLSAARWVREALFATLAATAQAGWLGAGEEAFRDVSASDAGVVVLAATVGWVGALGLVTGWMACIVWLLAHARRGHLGDQGRAIVWTAASGAIAAALLAPGGFFLPAVTLGAVFVWGLLPSMLGRKQTARSGAVLLAGMIAIILLAGVARKSGLLSWGSHVFGATDAFLHTATGLMLGMLMAWLLGARKLALGLVGILLAALAGGPGEVLQYVLATRTAEFRDWLHHGIGSAAAVVPYLLCVGARWCESPDAAVSPQDAVDAYLFQPVAPRRATPYGPTRSHAGRPTPRAGATATPHETAQSRPPSPSFDETRP